ncbi:DUF2680 domain-containing protein [Aquibacillus kalidii]|uniref:DUF2680 domain-containing protein n=1 Tax=Aquibacillus kalidii TaxID=2762597 RepID=UPI0016479012|nr:DUF2680 domain-containing protein [Aquibacillus kalidii]
MKKLLRGLVAFAIALSVAGAGITSLSAEEGKHMDKPEFKEVKLTEEQVEELRTLHENLINQRKGIINKYVEFGVLSEADATKMKEHLDMFLEKMEKDGFIPKWDKHHHKNQKAPKENE